MCATGPRVWATEGLTCYTRLGLVIGLPRLCNGNKVSFLPFNRNKSVVVVAVVTVVVLVRPIIKINIDEFC